MPDFDLIDPADPVERQNQKLRRIVQSLMDRVERNTDQAGNAYSLFQRAIALEGEVKARTRDLQRTLDELNRVNHELEAASAVADEANRAKSRFVAAASHDVRQPLNAAKLFVASLAETDLDAHQLGILDRLSSAFQSVEGLLGSLLDISRLDSSSVRVDVSRFPIEGFLTPLITEMAPVAAQKGVTLRTVPCWLWVESDPQYLRQIVQNILSNAIYYSGGGQVLVGCRRRGGVVQIQVHDTGPGIAEDDLPLIFEEFRRLPRRAGDSGQEGAGLGLAIVRRAAALLSHNVDVRSTVGRGTVFSVTVPVCPAAAGRAAMLPESAETPIVMLISHDDAVTERLLALVEAWGAGALAAASLGEAERLVKQMGVMPDAVLVDADAVLQADHLPLTRFLERAASKAILAPARGRKDALPKALDSVPRLGRPLQPYRLRAALFRGPGAH